MSAELAYQKADKHLCVALHRKLRLGYALLWNLFAALETRIYAEYCHIKRKVKRKTP
jgi:hypothetical protein